MKPKSKNTESGSARMVTLALVSFLAGIAVTAIWFHHAADRGSNTGTNVSQAAPPPPEAIGLPPAPTPTPAPPPAKPQPTDPAVIAQVKKTVPNFASISLDDGEQALRIAALKEFADATVETDAQIKTAQQQLQDAQNNNHGSTTAADQQAAMKHVQDTQAVAAEKLKQIAANLQVQIDALKSLKSPR